MFHHQGEIVSATNAGVPIVLVMMQDVKLDLASLPQRVRRSISEAEIETLEPYGIGYEEIERSYELL